MNNKIKIIALVTCLIMIFSLPSYSATKHKKVIHKNKIPIVKQISNPPIIFDMSSFIAVKKTDEGYNEYPDFEVRKTRIETNSIDIPELKLITLNNTKKDIIAFEFTCNFTDSFNRPVYKLGTKNKIFKGIVQNVRLYSKNKSIKDLVVYDEIINYYSNRYSSLVESGATTQQEIDNLISNTIAVAKVSVFSGEYSFNLFSYGLSTNVENIKLTQVKFSDGTVWKR